MNLITFFNWRLAHIAPVGYQRAVAFTQPAWNVPPKPVPIPLLRGKSAEVRALRLAVHRANRKDFDLLKPYQREKRREAARRWHEEKRLLAQMEAVTQES